MIVRRALSVAVLGTGMWAWVQAHWPSAVGVIASVVALWALIGAVYHAFAYEEYAEKKYNWRQAKKILDHPGRCGPIVWLWKLVVTPWLQKEDGGPDGF